MKIRDKAIKVFNKTVVLLTACSLLFLSSSMISAESENTEGVKPIDSVTSENTEGVKLIDTVTNENNSIASERNKDDVVISDNPSIEESKLKDQKNTDNSVEEKKNQQKSFSDTEIRSTINDGEISNFNNKEEVLESEVNVVELRKTVYKDLPDISDDTIIRRETLKQKDNASESSPAFATYMRWMDTYYKFDNFDINYPNTISFKENLTPEEVKKLEELTQTKLSACYGVFSSKTVDFDKILSEEDRKFLNSIIQIKSVENLEKYTKMIEQYKDERREDVIKLRKSIILYGDEKQDAVPAFDIKDISPEIYFFMANTKKFYFNIGIDSDADQYLYCIGKTLIKNKIPNTYPVVDKPIINVKENDPEPKKKIEKLPKKRSVNTADNTMLYVMVTCITFFSVFHNLYKKD